MIGDVGKYKQYGTFQQNQPIDNGSGGQDDNYVTLLTTRGKLRQKNGMKRLEQGELVLNSGWTWECRFQSALAIDTDTRIIISGQTYRVNSFQLIDQLKHYYLFDISKT